MKKCPQCAAQCLYETAICNCGYDFSKPFVAPPTTTTSKPKPKASVGSALKALGLGIAVLTFTLNCLGPSAAYFAGLVAGGAFILLGIVNLAASLSAENSQTDVKPLTKANADPNKDCW